MSKEKNTKIPLLPLNGRIIVVGDEENETKVTKTGLYLSDSTSSNDSLKKGTVVKVGLEKTDDEGNKIAFNVKEGQKVMYTKYAGEQIEFEGEKYILMKEEDLVAIYEG